MINDNFDKERCDKKKKKKTALKLSTLDKISADDILKYFLFFPPRKQSVAFYANFLQRRQFV